MLKIRRPLGRLIFNMGIAIPGKTVFLIETDPWCFSGECAPMRFQLLSNHALVYSTTMTMTMVEHASYLNSTHEHYNDVIMSTIASQITSLTIVYSTAYSSADQR